MVGGEVECDEAEEEEEVEGDRVARALHAGAQLDLVCIDSGCNRVILVDADEVDEYVTTTNKFLRTAQADARLKMEGRGNIGDCPILHISGATANLMSTRSIVKNDCLITFGYNDDDEVYWYEIECRKGREVGMGTKTIAAIDFNDLW